MSNCPRCHQRIDSQAIACPYCGAALKAYGHPGIPLHQAVGKAYLCDSCTYHEDDTCTLPQRPMAKECTLYNDRDRQQLEELQRRNSASDRRKSIRLWWQRNQALLMLLAVAIVSFALALKKMSK